MNKFYLTAIALLWSTAVLWAQPSNNECVNAIPLTELDNWCSGADAYTTINATASGIDNPTCFPNNQDVYDVWFAFTASAVNVSVSVIGETNPVVRGTLRDPQFALYEGDCDNLGVAIACASDNSNNDGVTIVQSGLTIGQTYYIRVSARYEQTGTFEICINNYNEVPAPDGDCPTAVILCDKEPFAISFVSGVGNIPNEIGDVSCNTGGCNFDESSSTWYKWTCDESGPLAFTLRPNNPADDLDFVVYELPNGLDDCTDRQDLRCMASGENVGAPFEEWEPCTGETGLSLADNDDSETCGCQDGDNNFARAVDMVSGRSYALVVNNFSQSGSGFSIEFDQSPGTGTFLGPEADFLFEPSVACVGEAITFTDASTFIGNIESYKWNFGDNADPATATGIGPHTVVYHSPGFKSVVLEVTSERGCIVTRIDLGAEVVCCSDHFDASALVSDVDCSDSMNGMVDFNAASNYGPYSYIWDTGATSEDINNLLPGNYTVTISDQAVCESIYTYTVSSPPPFSFDTLITMPTCNGGTDGIVTLEVNGGTPPYEYNWNAMGFVANNTLGNISQGDYNVIVRDANGCTSNQVLAVRELELMLDPSIQAIIAPSCFGFSDGAITIAINNGLPPYQYNFNNMGFSVNNTLENIPSGVYQVEVTDANLCRGLFDLDVQDYPPLMLDFNIDHVSCFGEFDGAVLAIVEGGYGQYVYNWSNSINTAFNNNIPAGSYALTVTDENDCLINDEVIINQPDSLGLEVVDVIDNICFGENNGSVLVNAVGGTPPYLYTINGVDYQETPLIDALYAGVYEIEVLDAEGCTTQTIATVSQPAELIVEAGDDRLIVLGYDTIVNVFSNYSPVTFEWSPMDSLECLNDDCSRVLVNPTSRTTYQVTVINEDGCPATDVVTIRVIKNRPVYIPNGFSPNNDGVNDGFTVFAGPGLQEIEKLQIFNRWGGLVFETKNIPPNIERLGWNGRFRGEPVNPGVFVYVAHLRFVDQEVIIEEGDVTVVK